LGGKRFTGSPPGGPSGQVAELLDRRRGHSRQRGKTPRSRQTKAQSVKFFNAIELIALLADPDWLDEATKTISQYWRRKNARRNGVAAPKGDEGADAANGRLQTN
jgi:hypothetical protein